MALGDVLDHADHVQRGAVGVADQREHEVGPDLRAVRPEVGLLQPQVVALAGEQVLDPVPQPRHVLRVDERPDRAVRQLLGRAAEDLAHRPVEIDDAPLRVGEPDPDQRVGEHGLEAGLAGPSRLLGRGARGERRRGDLLLFLARAFLQRPGVAGGDRCPAARPAALPPSAAPTGRSSRPSTASVCSIEPASVKWACTRAAPTRSGTAWSSASARSASSRSSARPRRKATIVLCSMGTKLVSATARAHTRASCSAVGSGPPAPVSGASATFVLSPADPGRRASDGRRPPRRRR